MAKKCWECATPYEGWECPVCAARKKAEAAGKAAAEAGAAAKASTETAERMANRMLRSGKIRIITVYSR